MRCDSNPNIDSSDVKRDMPRLWLPTTTNGLPKMMLNTQAWKESVTTRSASMKPRSHCSKGGTTYFLDTFVWKGVMSR